MKTLFTAPEQHPGGIVRVCPICGSYDLLCDIIVTAAQDLEGNWALIPETIGDLNYDLTQPNIEIRCGNDFCGPMYSTAYSGPIVLAEDQTMYQWYCEHLAPETHEPCADPEQDPLYMEFVGTIYHVQWTGTIADANTL